VSAPPSAAAAIRAPRSGGDAPALADAAAVAQWFAAGRYGELAALAGSIFGDPQTAAGISIGVLRYVALACAMSGRADAAEWLFDLLIAREPQRIEHRMDRAVLYLRSGRYAECRDALRECTATHPAHVPIRFNLGLAHFCLDEFAAAAEQFRLVLRSDPQQATARIYLARCCIEVGHYEAAENLVARGGFDAVIDPRERHELGSVYFALGLFEAARIEFERLLAQMPGDAEAALAAAQTCERLHRNDDARRLLQSVTLVPALAPRYLLLCGVLSSREGNPLAALNELDAARAALTDAGANLRGQELLSEIELERGKVLDRLGRYAEAFAAFSAGKQRARAAANGASTSHHAADELERQFDDDLHDRPELDAAVFRAQKAPGDAEQPIFLVGFPRSGTTLIDQMLDAHPELQVMEERPVLETVVKELRNTGRRYPDLLADLDAAALRQLRTLYWSDAQHRLRRRPGTRLVDKYPFNLAHLQLAKILFPDAQWIFAVRHPCDVVLSCFMQNLRSSDITQGFWSLEQAAALYARLIGRWLAQRSRLQPSCHDQRYETLVEHFEDSARALLGFLGLHWHPAVLRYAEHARGRAINTPSYADVVRPIYRHAIGRWLHYRPWFGSAERTLAPLVEQLGYGAPGDGRSFG
jgi:tetratricopeptide (TPR) repeat protein